jgi:hypothetical protein
MATEQSTFADFIANGEHLNDTLLANIAEVPHLEAPRVKFAGILGQLRTLAIQHDLYTANKQQVSKQLYDLLPLAKKLATFLRSGLREHYGNRNDKLLEFGVPTFRRRAPKAPTEQPPEGETPLPPSSGLAAPDDSEEV